MTKTKILEILKDADVTSVEICYSGSGDDGGIDDVIFTPEGAFNSDLGEQVKEYAYSEIDGLPDWINNAGGGGTMTIDVEEGTVTAEHYRNIESRDYSSHSF